MRFKIIVALVSDPHTEEVMDAARESGATQIHLLRMRVGRMTGVVQEALEYAFDVVRKGTMAASAVATRMVAIWIRIATAGHAGWMVQPNH